jgi:diacylglycerol kinase (ATP)
MERAVIVYNPNARNAPKFDRLCAAASSMAAEGWQVDITITEAVEHALDIAREAATVGTSVVFACGGDGTINEVANGLARTDTALAVLRGGMGNVFAKEFGISRAPEAALRVLAEGERHRFDLGCANQRYFLLMAGIGFDADVVRFVPRKPKRLLGSTSYAIWGIWDLFRYRARDVELKLDGVERWAKLYWLLLGNTRSYGGILNITGQARVDDGLLDAYVFEGGGPGWLAATAARLALHRQDGGRGVTFQCAREVQVVTPGIPVQVDGEYICDTPARFSVEPAALDVLLAPGKAEAVFEGQ